MDLIATFFAGKGKRFGLTQGASRCVFAPIFRAPGTVIGSIVPDPVAVEPFPVLNWHYSCHKGNVALNPFLLRGSPKQVANSQYAYLRCASEIGRKSIFFRFLRQ